MTLVADQILRMWYGDVKATVTSVSEVINSSPGKLYGLVVEATTANVTATVYNATTTGQTSGEKLSVSIVNKGETKSILLPVPVKMSSGIVVQTTGTNTTVLYD